MDGVDGDSSFDSIRNGIFVPDFPLVEYLVSSDVNQLHICFVVSPFQLVSCFVDNGSAILFAASGCQGEKFLRDSVQVGGQRSDLPDIISLITIITAVFIERNLYSRRFSVIFERCQRIDDIPKPGFCLFDQSLHAARCIEKDGDLYFRLVLFLCRFRHHVAHCSSKDGCKQEAK